jgi:predicted PurR-regulated permease PerM
MKTFILCIVSFIIWFILWWAVSFNWTVNLWFDAITEYLQNNIKTSSDQLNHIVNQKKDEIVNYLETQKEKIISDVKQYIKEKIQEQVNKLIIPHS